jgi:hypothetical protein
MTEMTDDILDCLFHGCAWSAYLEVLARTGQFPPDSETTRILAYRLYEEALAEKNGRPPTREADPGCEATEGGGPPRQHSPAESP